jgi:hypothetical protein
MPITWELRGDVLVVTVVGEYDPQGFPRVVSEVQSDPRYRAGLSMLFDARRSRAVVTKDYVQEWTGRLVNLPRLGFSKVCAAVVGEEPYRFGMARMAAAHLAERGVALLVTRDFIEALAELARGSEEPPPGS